MTSLTCSEILTRLGWTETSTPNSVLRTFTTPKWTHPDAWRTHPVNQYLFTMCLNNCVGTNHYKVTLGWTDSEMVRGRW